jgi:hypothetical protein
MIWFSRIVLGAAALLLLRISVVYITDPVGAVATHAIALGSAEAITNTRVSGAVFLGIALALAGCLASNRRLLAGIGFLCVIATTILIIRVMGAVIDGPAPFTMKVLVPETVLVVLSGTAFFLERRRTRSAGIEGARAP